MSKIKIIASIDIGSSKIASLIAQVRPESPDKVHIIGASSVQSRGVRKGQIVDIEDAVGAILESVEASERMAGYNMGKTWIIANGSHIGSQNSHGVVAVSQPEGEITSEDSRRVLEAARAVSLPTASEIIHVIPRSYTVDSQDGVKDPAGMTGVRLEVDTHIITGSSPVLKNLHKCASEVGCDVAGVVFSALASATSVLSETEKELGVVVVDIGGGTTSVSIFNEGALCYSSVLPVGAINVTKDLSAGLRISLESAEKIKIYLSKQKVKEDEIDISSLNLDEELKNVSYKTLVEGIIRPRLNELFQLIGAEIKKSGFAGLTPSGMIITGGGALTVGIQDAAKRTLGMPVKIGYPTGMTGLIDDINNPAFAGSIGLLKFALKEEDASQTQYPSNNFSFTGLDKIPGKDILTKVTKFIRSLLP